VVEPVVASGPDPITQRAPPGAGDRLHAYASAATAWWVRFFFRATKFHDDERDLWFCPFESASDATYVPRRTYLENQVATGYSPEDIKHIAALLTADTYDETLAHSMDPVASRRFFRKELHRPV